MATYYLGQIVLFAGSYAPDGFLPCDGRQLAIAQYDALFSLIGIAYGGDGRTTFNLPDLRSRVPVCKGQGYVDPKSGGGPTLSAYTLGQKAGVENVAVAQSQIPSHTHPLHTSNLPASTADPSGALLANVPSTTAFYCSDTPGGPTPTTLQMGAQSISSEGASAAHSNLMPSLALTYIICVQGLYPTAG